MKEIRVKVSEQAQRDFEFALPVEEVADALDVSTEELLEAVEENQIGYRKTSTDNGGLVIQVEAYGRHCTLRIPANV